MKIRSFLSAKYVPNCGKCPVSQYWRILWKHSYGWLPKFNKFFLVQRHISGKISMTIRLLKLLTDKQENRQRNKQTNKRRVKHNLFVGGNYNKFNKRNECNEELRIITQQYGYRRSYVRCRCVLLLLKSYKWRHIWCCWEAERITRPTKHVPAIMMWDGGWQAESNNSITSMVAVTVYWRPVCVRLK